MERIEYLDTNAVYVIRFTPHKSYPDWVIYDFKVFVNTSDYAILKEDFNNSMTPKVQKMLNMTKPYRLRKIKWYKKIGKNYLPYLLEYIGGIKDQGFKFSKREMYHRHSFIMINEIVPKRRDYDRIKWREKEKENDILYQQKFTYNKTFWDNFNVLYTQEEVSKAKQVMSKEKDIEQQFIDNSK